MGESKQTWEAIGFLLVNEGGIQLISTYPSYTDDIMQKLIDRGSVGTAKLSKGMPHHIDRGNFRIEGDIAGQKLRDIRLVPL